MYKNFEKIFIPSKILSYGYIPSEEECYRFWDEYGMMEHIKDHSRMVAKIALNISVKLKEKYLFVDENLVYVTGLLHDIAKTYTIKNGGYHSQLGAVWMLDRTKNYAIAHGIMHHVFWPGPIDLKKYWLPLIIVYSDKRVNHDMIVSLEERQSYILKRYGKTYERMQRILYSFKQAREIEETLTKIIGGDLDACIINSRGMVS